ncbi:hypothetical protein THAOC_32391, partial [Thalassiosira oceanica]
PTTRDERSERGQALWESGKVRSQEEEGGQEATGKRARREGKAAAATSSRRSVPELSKTDDVPQEEEGGKEEERSGGPRGEIGGVQTTKDADKGRAGPGQTGPRLGFRVEDSPARTRT